MHIQRCGWKGTLYEFLSLDLEDWETALAEFHTSELNEKPSSSQLHAWVDCYYCLKNSLKELLDQLPEALNWNIIFEYQLPRERGRRPDVLILSRRTIFVLEFKGYSAPLTAHFDQVSTYSRDLSNYHAASHNNPVKPILVLSHAKDLIQNVNDVWAVSPNRLANCILQNLHEGNCPVIDPNQWVDADYDPLPSLVSAARMLFKHEPLPTIRRAQSAGIPQAIADLITIANRAQSNHEHHLALVTGVPGAGKTLVGLQFVYDHHFSHGGSHRSAVFLSGNGPLVSVLRYVLQSSVFVQDVHGFLKQYGGGSRHLPVESIFVYDEAQRAWDETKVKAKRPNGKSEPEDFLRIGQRKPWALMVGLIGEGQEIHDGEEAGLKQWNDAIQKVQGDWIVHCPAKISHLFNFASRIHIVDSLNLTQSLRSHLAEHLQEWVQLLLNGQILTAGQLMGKIRNENFNIYITRDINLAKRYVRERYAQESEKRFGLIASSKAKNLVNEGVLNDFAYTDSFPVGPWYDDDPKSAHSCCQLEKTATEFQCQGLELDLPIVCWGNDLVWANRWVSPRLYQPKARDPYQLRLNSYRVLLTRGRDGMVIFVPDKPEMHPTYQALCKAGATRLT